MMPRDYDLSEILANLCYDYPGCSTEWLAEKACCGKSTALRHLKELEFNGDIRALNTGFGYFVRYEWHGEPIKIIARYNEIVHDPVIDFGGFRCPYCHEEHFNHPNFYHYDQTPQDRPLHEKLNERANRRAGQEP